MKILARAARVLPLDGQGFSAPPDNALAELRSWAARKFWRRVPPWSRPALVPLSRIGWAVAAVWLVGRFGWSRELLADCIRSGARPREAWIWRRFFPDHGVHPLGGSALEKLLLQVGDAAQHQLLSDKRTTCEMLRRAGLPVPQEFDAADKDTWVVPRALFVKPRFGYGARGTMAVDVIDSRTWLIDGRQIISDGVLKQRIARAGVDPIIQERLKAADELADLTTSGSPPVLRITVAREPRGAPFFHSALISIEVPGERKRDFIRGEIRAAVDRGGRMSEGLWFGEPGKRYPVLPWNSAPIGGRPVPEFDCAVEAVLSAMRLFPGLPLVNWDLIVTPQGPVILEGNSCGDWILTNFSTAAGIESISLAGLLRRWTEASLE
jgi:hypothetical protein